jgi:hypothetical protein
LGVNPISTQATSSDQTVFRYVENAAKTQIWIAVAVYVLVAIVKKRLSLDTSLNTLLQILSVTLFERMPIQQAFPGDAHRTTVAQKCNQLNLLMI